jgi:hypothetical protein
MEEVLLEGVPHLNTTHQSFFQNYQAHPLGIECSAQFVTAVAQDVQRKVFNRVLLLSADFGIREVQPVTVSASKSA